MPIEAVKIPQNVYVEDRIIGPITLKHLLILGIGSGISYAIFASVQKAGVTNVVFLGACWIPAVIAAAFAFFRINDMSLFRIILLSLEGFNKPSQRYWSPYPGISINLITTQHAKKIVEESAKAISNAEKLADMTRQMEKRQEEINKMSAHDNPGPSPVEAIQTQISEHMPHGMYEHEESMSLPVQPDRVQTEGFDPQKSVDGIQIAGRYDHLLHS